MTGVSAIIPVYNGTNFLAEGLHSILAQTRPVDEIIVVDDGSTDGSADLARSVAPDARIIRQPRGGPAIARNTGAAAARHPLLAFLDHDDLWPPARTAQLLATQAANPHAAMICGRVEIIAMPGFRLDDLVARCNNKHVPSLLQSSIIAATAWNQLGGMKAEPDLYAEDIDFYLRLVQAGFAVANAETLSVIYRQHGGGRSAMADLSREGLLNSLAAWLGRRRAATA